MFPLRSRQAHVFRTRVRGAENNLEFVEKKNVIPWSTPIQKERGCSSYL